jgi:type I restriction enzyme, R subunit
MNEQTPHWKEDHISQIPAIQLLMKLGFEYLPPEETVRARSCGSAGMKRSE